CLRRCTSHSRFMLNQRLCTLPASCSTLVFSTIGCLCGPLVALITSAIILALSLPVLDFRRGFPLPSAADRTLIRCLPITDGTIHCPIRIGCSIIRNISTRFTERWPLTRVWWPGSRWFHL